MNAVDTPLRRLLPNDYEDQLGKMSGQARRNPRKISNIVFSQAGDRKNTAGASDFVWQWGQFLDHDIDLTGGTDPNESVPIPIPSKDRHFLPGFAMDFNRSIYGIDRAGIRQQVNEITGWIDASNVYGSDDDRSAALRTLDGTGRLKTSAQNLLPRNVDGLENAGGPNSALFLGGDVRVNEQVALTAMHTLFMREHNRWAGIFLAEESAPSNRRQMYRHKDKNGNWTFSDRPQSGHRNVVGPIRESRPSQKPKPTGDEIFERARAMVAAEMQHITYTEFLPVLLGRNALPRYGGYRPGTDARIMNVFSTAAFRLGHSMLSPTLLRLDRNGQPIANGHLELRNGFFAPDQIRQYGIEPLLRGLSQQLCQDVDSFVVDDVRNFLFGDPKMGGFDLVSLNIQRGRDHGLPSYNSARRALNLKPVAEFGEISSDPVTVSRLKKAYTDVEDIDLWVGGVAEDNFGNSMLGELFHTIVMKQFEALRAGDRFWYTKVLSRQDRERVEALSLADIIRLNTNIGDEIQDNVFLARKLNATRRRRP